MRVLEADYVIVGAGSAGAVLANRLSEHHHVVLIEAGPRDPAWDFRLQMPAALSEVLSTDTYNWFYHSDAEPHLNNREMYCPRGRVLGGSSAINGMIFVRGHRSDFDRWASEFDLPSWRYEECLPYFRRSESFVHGASEYRGDAGPLPISRGALAGPLHHAWLAAVAEAGLGETTDFNGQQQEGGGPFDRSIANGRRMSTSQTYLKPVRQRAGLQILTRTHATSIRSEQGRATAVQCRQGREALEVRAAKEVLLCGGAINSPQLLMLSGIGPAEHLQSVGINPVLDRPGVGRNLMDHLEIYVQWACRKPVSIYPYVRWYRKPFVGLQWYLNKTGAGATNHFETGAFLRSGLDAGYPDLQFHFLPIAMNYDGSEQHNGHGFQVHVGPMKPTSRGAVTLASDDPRQAPRIQFNYHATEQDRQVMYRGIRMAREIVSQQAFSAYRGDELRPGNGADSDSDLDHFVRTHAESAYHPSGTCRMGTATDPMAVVDAAGHVHGMSGLRVIDASIMPEITNGNLNAPVIMMAEKLAADIQNG